MIIEIPQSPTSWPLQKNCDVFYGNPRGPNGHYSTAWAAEYLVHVQCPWALYMDKQAIPFIQINKNCAESLTKVLGNIWDAAGKLQENIDKWHYSEYSGSFNYRPIRGGQNLSMHAYGCAIDWDADENQQHSHKHLFQDNSLLVVKFKEEGWVWGGDWGGSSIDSMHVQAAKIR